MSGAKERNKSSRAHIVLLILFSIVFVLSVIKPKSYFIWFLEAFPVVIGVIILIYTYKKFQFTNLVYILILIQIIIILIGAHYTYGDVPLFNWIKETYGLSRNYYDRMAHLTQGIIPAFIVRELLIRKIKFKKGIILSILVVCICLSISASYELIEWGAASLSGSSADDFLGIQGDKWDTQWDMFCSLIGSIITVVIFSKVHDESET
jgi:Predicted membrane protein